MDTRLSLEVVQCRQFDPVSGPFSMNNERKDDTQSVYTIGSQRNLVPIRSRRAYLKKRSQVPSLLAIILLFLAASLFVVVVVLSILYARSKGQKFCDSEDCVRIAASLKESMDTSVDPCDDFYTYACGRWPEEHPIPDTSLTNSWFNERSERVARKIRELLRKNITTNNAPWAVAQAKILYTSCMDVIVNMDSEVHRFSDAMDELGLEPLFDLLDELNLPPMPAALTKKTGNFIEHMAKVKRILGRDIFFGLDVIPDPRNKSNNIMLLDTPSMSSPLPNDKDLEKRLQSIRSRLRKLEENTQEEEETSEFEDAELAYMKEVIKYVISNGTTNACSTDDDLTSVDSDQLKNIVETIYDLSNHFYFLFATANNDSRTAEDLSDADYMLVDDLQKLTDEYVMELNSSLTPKPIWRPFFEFLFDDIITLDLSGKDKILIGNLAYLKGVALTLSLTEEDILETYIWWVIIDIAASHSSEGLRKIWSNYIHQVMDVEVSESKSLHCASAVNQLMGMAVSWLFVDPTFHEGKGKKVHEMLDDIKQAFSQLVMNTDWMDEETKLATLEKNKKMRSEIGFPKWLFKKTALDDYYEGLGNGSNGRECVPQFSCESNKALNYGAIGTVLGHELTHGFDNSGRHYDSDGNLRQWWTNGTISEYTARTECFIKHYNSYYEDEIDDYIDGELTLGENIADNGGLREAVIAYKRWKARHGQEPLLPGFTHLTHEQLVFLSFAHLWCEAYTAASLHWMLLDSHCPGHIRLLAVLKNSEEFSQAWKCPLGSNMNPRNKCHVW